MVAKYSVDRNGAIMVLCVFNVHKYVCCVIMRKASKISFIFRNNIIFMEYDYKKQAFPFSKYTHL